MEHLLSAWPKVLAQFRQSKHILLFSDYDGTLTPIVESPELADISDNTRRLLQALAFQRRLTVGVISGRALSDLKDKVGVSGIIYAGNHGFEIEGPGLSFVNPLADEIRPFFRAMSQLLTLALETTKGVFVENKGLTLSVHFRQMADENARNMKSAFRRVINGAQSKSKFKITPGKKVYELRPAIDWDKGKAIKLLMQRYAKNISSRNPVVPIYLGDDLTDEDGFAAIGQHGNGIAVHIGNNLRRTTANYFLKSPDEVIQFLTLLQECLKRGFK